MLVSSILFCCVILLTVSASLSFVFPFNFGNKNILDETLQSLVQFWKKTDDDSSSVSLKNELLAVPVKKMASQLSELALSGLDTLHGEVYAPQNLKSFRLYLEMGRKFLDYVETFTHAMEDPENSETILNEKSLQFSPELKHFLLGMKYKNVTQFNLALLKTDQMPVDKIMLLKILNGDFSAIKLFFRSMLFQLSLVISQITPLFSQQWALDLIKTLPVYEQKIVNALHQLLSKDPSSVISIGNQWIDQVFEAIEEVWQRRVTTTTGVPTALGKN